MSSEGKTGASGTGAGRTMVCTLDLFGRLKYYNRTVEELLATDGARLLGTPFASLLSNGSAPAFESALQECLQGRSVRERLTIELGEAEFTVSMTPVKEREEVVGVSLLGFLIDPDRRQLSLGMVLDVLQDHSLLAMVYSRDGEVHMVNPPLQRFLQRDRGTVEGKGISSLLHGQEDQLDKALLQPEPPSFITLPMDVQGRPVKLTWSLHPFVEDGKDMVLAVADLPALPRLRAEDNESLLFLAESSADLISEGNPSEMLQSELDNLLHREGLDFAVVRLLGWDGRPQLFCSGVDFKQARALFDAQVGEGTLAMRLAKGEGCVVSAEDQQGCGAMGGLGAHSLICLPLRFRGDLVGAAVFGKRAAIEDLETRKLALQVLSNQMAMIYFYSLLNEHYLRACSELQALLDISRLVSSTLDHREVLDIILSKARELVESDNCIIYGLDRDGGRLVPLTYLSRYEVDPQALVVRVGEGITGDVARTGKGELVERADLDPRAKQVDGTPDEPSSLICVPLRIGDEVLGVMTLEKVPGRPFTPGEYRLMEMYAPHAAMALKNSGLFQDIRSKVSAQKMYNILLTHDVANYNVPIHGFLEMLLKDPKLDERQRRYVRSALAQSQNVSNLIADIRKLWNIMEDEGKVELLPVDIIPLLHAVVQEIRASPLYSDLPIELQYPGESAWVLADPLVRDVLFNLISNAAKYGETRKVEVVVRPEREGDSDHWRVEVRDQGKGVPDDRKPAIFQRFESLGTDVAAESHGLGLSVVKALVDRYHGRVWVEDRVKGDHTKGATFVLLLPKAR